MTHLSEDLNKICIKWCPVVDECPSGHYCKYMDKIRKLVIEISDFRMFMNEKNE